MIVQVDDLLVKKLITPITLREYLPLECFNRKMITSTHMVSCHETLVENRSSEDEQSAIGLKSSKTKEEDKVVVAPIVFTLIFQYP